MAYALVQPAAHNTNTGNSSSINTSLTGVGAGNMLVAFGTQGANTTCTFSGGGTWATVGTPFYYSSAGQLLAIGYCASATGGNTTVTATFGTATNFQGIILAEFSGNATSTPLDVNTAGRSNAASTTPTDASMTTTVNGDLVVSFIIGNNTTTYTAGTGFTLLYYDSSFVMAAEYQVQSAAGAIAPSFASSGSVGAGTMSAALKPASGGGGPAPTPDIVMAPLALQYVY